MITPELMGYIKGELAKGRTHEEIHASLVADGGWGEVDISEAFRSVLPMQGAPQDTIVTSNSFSEKTPSRLWKIILIIAVVLAFGFAVWFFRKPLAGFWDSGIDKISSLFVSYFTPKAPVEDTKTVSQNNTSVVVPVVSVVKDCGTTNSPDPKIKSTYENNAVLNCLGASALRCENAKAVLNDALFPNVFQVVQNINAGPTTCNFRLSYGADSTLIDITGKKLALQSISCPVSIVKAISETNNTQSFNNPSTNNPNKYASEIYLYGTLGLFIENTIDKNKIEARGCSGDYITTVLAGYRNMQSQN